MLDLYVDADGCPVKEEVYRVARRCGLTVFVDADKYLSVPAEDRFHPGVLLPLALGDVALVDVGAERACDLRHPVPWTVEYLAHVGGVVHSWR